MTAYAYILTHPGIPCVFWPHFFDWGADYRDKLTRLIQIRRAAGINSASPVRILNATAGLYAAIVYGSSQWVAVKLGASWQWNPGPGWTPALSGERFAIWTQPAAAATPAAAPVAEPAPATK